MYRVSTQAVMLLEKKRKQSIAIDGVASPWPPPHGCMYIKADRAGWIYVIVHARSR
jgi:hypothetical protein